MISARNVIPADAAAIGRAADIIRHGGLVAFPTETVYGLGGDATNDKAVTAIFAAKDRPRINPLIVHVQNIDAAERIVEFNDKARALADHFWPGPLTLVLPRKANAPISLLASAGLDTVAVRVPSHPVARKLLNACGVPIAAPSANPSGRISATTALHVAEELGSKIDLILDAGPVPIGLESTVIGFGEGAAVLLRPGAVPRERIEAITGELEAPETGTIRAPGQLSRHYAPRTPLRLDAMVVLSDEALLAFGADIPRGARIVQNLSERGDLAEAAANLFVMLRELDAARCSGIAVMPIPEIGLGEAINDRLRRAAAKEE